MPTSELPEPSCTTTIICCLIGAMNIHEYQAKEILTGFGIKIPKGRITQSSAEAYEVAQILGGTVAVKAQVHAGGRGKGGGVKIAHSAHEAEQQTLEMLGSRLVTPQTGPEGTLIRQVLIEEGLDIEKEFYLGMVIDRSREKVVLMGSTEGGMEIEEVALKTPELILKEHVDPALGLQGFQSRNLAYGLGLGKKAVSKVVGVTGALYKAFVATDASLVEINPLVLTKDGELYALDAKMNFDDNALYRQPNLRDLRDFHEEDPLEILAHRSNLNYIKLDGNVGCMVNGAGLAMATMDIIKLSGGNPANFLDVGGGASVSQVKTAFQILISDYHVQAVLINIFGGIMRCDTLAEGVVQAAREVGVGIPVVVRLEGTNVEQGREILRSSGLDFEVAYGMQDAAEKVCHLANKEIS